MDEIINIDKELKYLNRRGDYGSAKDKSLLVTEFEILNKELTNPMDRTILSLGYLGGLRAGEMLQCRLSWMSWVEFNNKRVLKITIPDNCRDINNKHSIWKQKKPRKNKDIDYTRQTYVLDVSAAVELYSYFQHNESIPLTTERTLSEYRVKVKLGSLLTDRTKVLSSHCLRAGATDNFRILGFSIRNVAYMLGHRDERTTLGHYNKPTQAGVESSIMEIMNK